MGNKKNITAALTQGKNCRIAKSAVIGYAEHGGRIILGNGVQIREDCIIRTCTGIIKMGNGVIVSYRVIMHGQGGITIGAGTIISPNVGIYAANHGIKKQKPIMRQPNYFKGIRIGVDTWIGANCVILDGAKIGKGAVIGAASVVANIEIPEYEIWAGNPIVKIGERT